MKISKIHIRHSWIPNSHTCCTPDRRFCSHGTSPPARPLLSVHSCCLSCFWQSYPGLGRAGPCLAPLLLSLTVTLTLNSSGIYKPEFYEDLSLGTGWAPGGSSMEDWGSPLPACPPVFIEFLHNHGTSISPTHTGSACSEVTVVGNEWRLGCGLVGIAVHFWDPTPRTRRKQGGVVS